MPTETAERQLFLERRKGFVGGSEAASLFPEESQYGCPRRLTYIKRGITPDYERTQKEKDMLERGNEVEDIIADKFSRMFGMKVRRTPTFVMADKPFIGVNMDRQIVSVTTEEILVHWPDLKLEGACGPGYLECKSANQWAFASVIKSGIPFDYVAQVQHGIGARGYKWGVMAIMDMSSFQMITYAFTANSILIVEIQRRAENFWPLVTNPSLPLPDKPEFKDGNKRCHGCQYRRSCLGAVALMAMAGEKPDTEYVSDDSFYQVLSDLKEIREEIDKLQFTEEQIENVIKERMTEKNIGKLEVPSMGARVSWVKGKPPMSWDGKALEAEGGTIGRILHFVEWLKGGQPEEFAALEADFQKEHPKSDHLDKKYKKPGTPRQPFVVKYL